MNSRIFSDWFFSEFVPVTEEFLKLKNVFEKHICCWIMHHPTLMPKSCAVVKKILFLLIDEQIINMVCNSQGEKEAEDTDDVASMISHYDGLY